MGKRASPDRGDTVFSRTHFSRAVSAAKSVAALAGGEILGIEKTFIRSLKGTSSCA
jgi:hypothetical protein